MSSDGGSTRDPIPYSNLEINETHTQVSQDSAELRGASQLKWSQACSCTNRRQVRAAGDHDVGIFRTAAVGLYLFTWIRTEDRLGRSLRAGND